MNAIVFANLLRDQAALKHVDPEILKALLEEYPYCQPLQELLKKKSILEQADQTVDSSTTSIINADQESLTTPTFETPVVPRSTSLLNETEELIELVDIKEDLEEEVLYFDIPDRKVEGLVWKEDNASGITMGKKKDKKTIKKFRKTVLKSPGKEPPSKEDSSSTATPEPKRTFRSWTTLTPQPVVPSDDRDSELPEEDLIKEKTKIVDKESTTKSKKNKKTKKEPKAKKKKKGKGSEKKAKTATKLGENAKKKVKVKHFARESIKNNPALISETLAQLLAKQGHIEKSIAMYEKLMLLIPEKSDFFASQIEKLKTI